MLFKKWRTQRLWKKAAAALEARNFDDALSLGQQLETEKYSGAFDIAAQAYAGLGRMNEAISTLERGLIVAPLVWLNWELLGNYRSDAGLFEDAGRAYAEALKCDNVWSESIFLNQAVLALRRGRPEEASALIDRIKSPELELRAADIKTSALLHKGDCAGVVALCNDLRSRRKLLEANNEYLASILANQARAMVRLGSEVSEARKLLLEALATTPDSGKALQCLREIEGASSARANTYGVTLSFVLDPGEQRKLGALGYLRSGQAIADTPEEAVLYFTDLEGSPTPSLKGPADTHLIEASNGAIKGVILRSPRLFYTSE
jgi:tetratricopeptide (TPR) repeat protein